MRGGGRGQTGGVEVSVESFVVESYVQVDDISIFQRSSVRDSMTDDFVDRSVTLLSVRR
jgi:hypothetical protein